VAAFRNFEEFWAALDRLDLDIARLRESQQKLWERLAKGARPVNRVREPWDRLAEPQQHLASTISALAERVARMADIERANEQQLGDGGARS
jgi:hypothetical protein